MTSKAVLRFTLQLSATLVCLLALAPRPAQACYCVEYTSCESIEVTPVSTGDGEETPNPNSYLVDVTWSQYVDNCTFTIEGTPTALPGWTEQYECTVIRQNVAPNGDSQYYTGMAECVVTATSETESESTPYGTTWTFRVTGNDSSSCTTDIFLPGTLPPATDPEAEPDPEADGEAYLNWKAPATGRIVATGLSTVKRYDIYRSALSGNTALKKVGTTTTTSFKDTGLTAGAGYKYEIYAADDYGQGTAAVVTLPGNSNSNGSDSVTGGCSSTGSIATPLGLLLIAAGMFARRRRVRT